MMERHDHNNPWADKLQDIRLPGEDVSWKAMEAVLDREMPVYKKDWRRWLLLIILLLLLIGVCNCPGRRLAGDRETAGRVKEAMKPKVGDQTDRPEVAGNLAGTVRKETPKTTSDSVAGKRDHRRSDRRVSAGGPGPLGDHGSKRGPAVVSYPASVDSSGSVREPGLMGSPRSVGGPGGKPTAKDTVSGKGKRNDSTATAAKKPKADSILQMKGWLAGIGLNQFFTLGQQQRSNYNSSGTTGGISDYIPVPMVRYYFSRKLYVQLEAQFNTPQYTTKNLLASRSKPDSLTIPGQVLQTSLYIKKLFYFNLPLSIHYSPVPNLYIGGGIQYARLTNGVALYQDSSHSVFISGADSLKSSAIKSFRNDPVFSKLKTSEFRLLLDLNYNFKRFVIGGRYNRALSDFIHLQLSNNQVSQSRNSSFQVYLRYIIWDGRKKTLLPK